MNQHTWAANKIKLFRAIALLRASGNAAPAEEEIKATYVKMGGLVIEGPIEAAVEEAPAPKKVAKK